MRHFLIVVLVLVAWTSYAQDDLKYGKVSAEDLKLQACDFHPDASALILGRSGSLEFFFSDDKGWGYRIDIVKRVKIFNTEGKDKANVTMTLYDPVHGSRKEAYGGLRGFTYNLVGGKVEKTKLEGNEIFTKRLSDYRVKVSFTMPNVKEGSVLEYKYTITSNYISNLYEWHFQEDIPTQFSRFAFRIPEYFNYRESHVGSVLSLETEARKVGEKFTYHYETTPRAGGGSQRGTGTLESESKWTEYTAKNVPALVDEPFMNNKPNLPSRIEFQLMSYQMPGGTFTPVASSYETFNKEMMESSSFGGAINKGAFAKEMVATLAGEELDKAGSIYTWLRDHFSFNGVISFTSAAAGRKAYNDGEGNVADINLSLVAAWRAAGLEAYPVILSTRGHGIPHPVYPNYEDFNYVIGAVVIDDKMYYCDAANTGSMPFGVLPIRCLNGKGWMATEQGGTWVDLKAGARGAISLTSQFEIVDDHLIVQHDSKYDGYDALIQRSALVADGEEGYEEKVISLFTDEVSAVEVKNETTCVKWSVSCESELEDPDLIYLKPIHADVFLQNKFKREERQSPIDFAYRLSRRVVAHVKVPEGYEVVEMPKPAIISLPDNGGRFMYQVQQNGNTISVSSMFYVGQLDFGSVDYPYLKQYFQMAVDKNNELIVLRKI